jgi:hypothetical protein
VQLHRPIKETSVERYDLSDSHFCHTSRIGEGRIEDGRAACSGRIEIDLIGPNAIAPDCLKRRSCAEHICTHATFGAYAEESNPIECGKKVVARERLVASANAQSGVNECFLGIRVNLLK